MIDDYRGLAVFVTVAETGSFSAAGRHLKLSTSVVSHHVSKLENKLGIPLFFRSTRSLSLTSEGQQILDAARRMVSAGEEALDILSDGSGQPVGALRISLPAFGDHSPIHQAVWRFAKAHPMVTLSVHSSDKRIDLIREGYDLAIRLGALADSTLKTRRIGTFHRVLAASPEYLASVDPVTSLQDLMARDFITYAMLPDAFVLSRDGGDVTFTPESLRLEVDSIAAGKAAVMAGLGILHLPRSELEPELQNGSLVEVLPEWRLPSLGTYAVWPDSGPQKKLTRRLIDHLAQAQTPVSA